MNTVDSRLRRKLGILADAAKYDASCASSSAERAPRACRRRGRIAPLAAAAPRVDPGSRARRGAGQTPPGAARRQRRPAPRPSRCRQARGRGEILHAMSALSERDPDRVRAGLRGRAADVCRRAARRQGGSGRHCRSSGPRARCLTRRSRPPVSTGSNATSPTRSSISSSRRAARCGCTRRRTRRRSSLADGGSTRSSPPCGRRWWWRWARRLCSP